MVVRDSTPLGCYLNVAVSSWVVQNDVDTEKTAVPDLRRPWNRDSETAQGRRKHFRIGQAMKIFLLAPLANFFSTSTLTRPLL